MAQYNPKSLHAEEFINHEEILETLKYAEENKHNIELIDSILEKARPQKTADRRTLCRSDASRSLRAAGLRYPRKDRGDVSAGRGDQAGVLRQPYRYVCTAVSVELLRQRLCLLSVSREKHAISPAKS